MLVWKDEYAIGVDIIDEQHKYLFEIGNNAYRLLKNDFSIDKYDDIVMIIEDLRNYAKFHFKTEEDYMLQINYSDYAKQKQEHDEFIDKVNQIDLGNVDENPQKYIEKILAFVFEWLLDHILQKDKKIKQ